MSVQQQIAAIAAAFQTNPGRIAAQAGSPEHFKEVIRDLLDYGHGAAVLSARHSPSLTDQERDLLGEVLWGNRPTTPALLH